MDIINVLIILIMIFGSIAAAYTKNLLSAVIIFAAYSLMMAVLWERLSAPDLAITEAAVGAGITTILFVLAIRRMKAAQNEKSTG